MSTRSPRESCDPGTVVTDLAGSIPASLRPLVGAVLAGGQSRRFGRDKTAVEVDGVPMALRAVRALESLCDDVVLVSSRDVPDSWGTVIPDRHPGLGPLAGIEAALRYGAEKNAAAVFILAAGLPHGGPEIVAAVAAGLIPESASAPSLAAAASRRGEPDFEPLCAAYDIQCAEMVTQLLDGGEPAARALVEAVDGRKVAPTLDEARTVSGNVNVPADLDRIP